MRKGNLKMAALFAGSLLCARMAAAQDIPGYNTSNYAGVSGTDLQPAGIAGMPYRFDMTLIGAGVDVHNNYLSVYSRLILDKSIFQPYDGDFKQHFLSEDLSSGFKSGGMNAWVQLPSFALSLSPTVAIGFTARLRSMMNTDQVNPELAHLGYSGLSMTDPLNQMYFKKTANSNAFNISQMSWWEYGIDYAQVLHNEGYHFLKAGVRLKMTGGLEAAYIYGNPVSYNWKNNDTLSLYNSDFRYGHTDNAARYADGSIKPAEALTSIEGTSAAMDIGLVYEWRPDNYSYPSRYHIPESMQKRNESKYKLRLGISLLDVGAIRFNKAYTAGDFTANKTNWNVHQLHLNGNPVIAVDTLISNVFGNSNSGGKFTFYLPSALSLQADYQVYKDLYLNFTSYTPLYNPDAASQVHALGYYTVTPRWDSKWFGVFMPMGINSYGQFTTGLTVRMGPLIVGTSNGLNLLLSSQVSGMNAYAALKLPVFYPEPHKHYRRGSTKGDVCPKF